MGGGPTGMEEDELDELEAEDDRASSIMRVGLARVPSWFSLGRYHPLRPSSSAPAWLLGTLGLIVPLLSAIGAYSGYRAFRRGSRLGLPAIAWCCLTAVLSIVMWAHLLADGEPATPAPRYELKVISVEEGVVPPPELGFASAGPTGRYAAVSLEIRNLTSDTIQMSPVQLDVYGSSGGQLAVATDDAAFLSLRGIPADGSVQVHVYVAMPLGSSLGSVAVGDAHARL